MTFRPLIVFIALLCAGSALFAQASRVYVDVTIGSDTYSGINPTNSPSGTGPKSTLHAGLSAVANGGTLVVIAGVYPGDGIDTDGSPSNPADNADIVISSAKYPNITTGITIELRAVGTNTEIRIEPDASTLLATNGALITHTSDDYIPNLVIDLPNGEVTILAAGGTEWMNLSKRNSNGSKTSGIILKAGALRLGSSSLIQLRSGASISMDGSAGFSDKAPSKGADLNLTYTGTGSITAGPESRYGTYGAGVLTVNKTAGSTIVFAAPMSFSGSVVPLPNSAGLTPQKGIVVASGSANFQGAISFGSPGSLTYPPTIADLAVTGSASATFDGPVSLVVAAPASLGDFAICSIENSGTGSLTFNGQVKWNSAWNAAGNPAASLAFGAGAGTALVRNATTGSIRFGSSVTLSTDSTISPSGDAYFSVFVQNDASGTLSFDQGISAPNTPGAASGNRNFTVHVLNAWNGILNVSGTIRGTLSNTGPAGGVININGPTTLSHRLVNAPGKTIALGSNILSLTRITGAPFLNDGFGGSTTPTPLNENTDSSSITTTSGALRFAHTSGVVVLNGGSFGNVRSDGTGGVLQLVGNRLTFNTLILSGTSLSSGVNTTVSGDVNFSSGDLSIADGVTFQAGSLSQTGGSLAVGAGASGLLKILGSFQKSGGTLRSGTGSSLSASGVSISSGDWTIGDGATVEAASFAQTGGNIVVGAGRSGTMKVVGSFQRSGGTLTAGTGSLIEVNATGSQSFNLGSLLQVYDIVFNNPGGTFAFDQPLRVAHSATIGSGTTLNLGSYDLIINGDSSRVTNGGTILGETGSLIFGGASGVQGGKAITAPVFSSSGSGLCSSIKIDIGTSNTLRSSGVVRIGRALDLRSGTLEIVSGDISPSTTAAKVTHDAGASKEIIRSGGTFGGLGVLYDLEYTGTLSSTVAASADLNGSVRTWTVTTNCDPNLDGDNNPATGVRYYIETRGTSDLVFGGVLNIGPVSAVRIASGLPRAAFVLSASGVTHTIRGILATVDPDDNVVINGSGVTILGSTATTEPALLGNTIVNTPGDCSIRSLHGLLGNLTAGAGSKVTLRMGSSTQNPERLASEQIVKGSLTLNGTVFTVASNVEIQHGVSFNSGTLALDVNNLYLTTAGDFIQSSAAQGFVTTSGFLVMNSPEAALSIGNDASTGVPNLRIISNTSLNGPGRVNGNLEIGTPSSAGFPRLRLGNAGNDLTVAGSVIAFTSDGTGNKTAVVGDGTSNGTPGGKLIIINPLALLIANTDVTIEELTYSPTGGAGTLNLVSSVTPPLVFSIGDILTQAAGDINLGTNHLVLLGTGSGNGSRAYNRTSGAILATTGEVRFEGLSAQQLSSGSDLSIPNLKINNSAGVSTGAATDALKISGRLDLGKGVFGLAQGKLVLGDSVTVTRRSNGALLGVPPTFGRAVNVWYLIEPSEGAITTQNEIPGDDGVLKNLRVRHLNQVPSLATVILGRNVSVHDTLSLEAGNFSEGPFALTMNQGAVIMMAGGKFDSTGSRSGAPIVTSYEIAYRTGTTVMSSNRELQQGAGIRPNLSVLSTSAGVPTTLVLHTNCTLNDLVIASEGGGLALGPAASRISRTLGITGDLTVRAGTFLSSTGIASRIDIIGTTLQKVTVPAAGILLPGGASSINLRLNNPAGMVLQGGNLTLDNGVVIFFVNGVLRTGPNALVLTQTTLGNGFDRSGVVSPNVSHVFGKVRHIVSTGAGSPTIHPNGRYEFPVGSATQYRPFALTFGSSYPAINAVSVDVEHQDGDPAGAFGFPLDGGNGVLIGNRSAYSWVVTTGTTGFASNQRYDLEVKSNDLIYRPSKIQDLRLVQRREFGGGQNAWQLQGSGAGYFGNEVSVSESGDTTMIVRSSYSNEPINAQGNRIAVGVPARPPVFLKSMRDTTIVENQRIDFPFVADPLDLGESIFYSLINPPAGASIDQGTGAFTWKPAFGQAGSYSLVVLASDGQFLAITTALVTVRRVNRPPAFTNVLRDTTIRDTRDTLRFAYSAIDPEGDPVLFNLVIGPPGMTLTNTGILKWVATPQQANQSYVVRVTVSDGTRSDSTTATVTVSRNRSRGDVDGDGLITSNDASLVLRHVVGIIVLSDPGALYAADASRDGTISAYDASLILQAAVGLIVIPSYSRQLSDATSGSGALPAVQTATGSLEWSVAAAAGEGGERIVSLRLSSLATGVYAVEWRLEGDFAHCPVQRIVPKLPQGWQMVEHLVDGELRIAMMGTTPLSSRELATIALLPSIQGQEIQLRASGLLNETSHSLAPLQIAAIPQAFVLEKNYPNPFNPGTTIRYQLPEKSVVMLVVYNLQGQKIRTLVDAVQQPGIFQVAWDGRNDAGEPVASGLYVCRLQAGLFVASQRMMLIR